MLSFFIPSSHPYAILLKVASETLWKGRMNIVSHTAITIYGCKVDEIPLFRNLQEHLNVQLTLRANELTEGDVEQARNSQCISISHRAHISNTALDALKELGVRYISSRSAGLDHIDTQYAKRIGITVENVEYSPDSVADYTLLLILASLRNLKTTVLNIDNQDYRLNTTRGRELRDLTIGVIGVGRIGRAVIDRLQGFGCNIVTHTRADQKTLNETLASCDIITLHTPLTPETHYLLNHDRIEHMKNGALIINTGRGALIDTDALLYALDTGKVSGAALDVLEGEQDVFYKDLSSRPLEDERLTKLENLPNVLITPHTAFYTDHALKDMVENTIANCIKFKQGEIL
jgi:D-specific alpha-keto acid dehydrogenase